MDDKVKKYHVIYHTYARSIHEVRESLLPLKEISKKITNEIINNHFIEIKVNEERMRNLYTRHITDVEVMTEEEFYASGFKRTKGY